ncbi:hypothetical protein [Kutzneria buriramensis]|uniref:hypothetical protein n=1 Tax=Kutzneria buriramensis TaxID=1045776 RepID=UPI0011C19F78|nr:hypothetical protein [Kutzneria buriramensis]
MTQSSSHKRPHRVNLCAYADEPLCGIVHSGMSTAGQAAAPGWSWAVDIPPLEQSSSPIVSARGETMVHRAVWVVWSVIATTVSLAGCTGTHHSSTVEATSAVTSTPSRDPGAEIADVYVKFWSVGNQVIHDDPSRWHDELAVVAADPELTAMLTNLKALRARSVTVYGATHEHVTKVDVAAGAATVRDCQDASESGQADAASGARKTVGIPRNPVTAKLVRSADGQWRVSEITYPGGTC